MLMYLLYPLKEWFSFFNVFQYLTFRTGGAMLTSLLICLFWGPVLIRQLRGWQKKGQPIREDGPQSHLLTKKGTPTMGGLMVLGSLTASTLLWSDLASPYVLMTLFITLVFGMIGFVDDYAKVSKSSVKGISGKLRLLIGTVATLLAGTWVYLCSPTGMEGMLMVPFIKSMHMLPADTYIPFYIPLGIFIIPFTVPVILGSANAVNLTDGLDGLATMPVIIAAAAFGLIAYLVGNVNFSHYLHLGYVAGAGELSVFCGALIGAGLGFLWFNAPPASVFMGDTGSLAMGAGLGTVAVVTRHELVLIIIGGLFVAETLSVILQVWSFKTRGKRIFRMAPLHHHFEQIGWKETKIVVRFWIIAFVLALIGLSSLKLR